MSSVFKTLKTSDITVYPYKANKSFSFESFSLSSNDIGILKGVNIPLTSTGSLPTSALYYRSARQLYYSHYVPSLAPNLPLSEQNYSQLEETQFDYTKTENYLIFDNYLQSTAASGSAQLDNRYNFPTGINEEITIISVPRIKFGEKIPPFTFALVNSGSYSLYDDGNGNVKDYGTGSQAEQLEILYRTSPQAFASAIAAATQSVHVGNILYAQGIVILTNQSYQLIFDSPQYLSTENGDGLITENSDNIIQ